RLLQFRRHTSGGIDLQVGLDLIGCEPLLAKLAGVSIAAFRDGAHDWFRFRTDSFVEPSDRTAAAAPPPPLQLTRGLPPGPEPTPPRAGAVAGPPYLARPLAETARYIHEVTPPPGVAPDPKRVPPYTLPRHAGVTYFLAQVYAATGDASLREPIERAFHQ